MLEDVGNSTVKDRQTRLVKIEVGEVSKRASRGPYGRRRKGSEFKGQARSGMVLKTIIGFKSRHPLR